jgi:hypothetical protein
METVLKDRDAMVALYAPYCEGLEQPELLQLALETLLTPGIHGSRRLKPDGNHPFELTWQPGDSPQEPSQCQLSFPQIQDVSYSFSVPTAQLVVWLMDFLQTETAPPSASLQPFQLPAPPLPPLSLGSPVPQNEPPEKGATEADGPSDLPESFWGWLLVGQLPTKRSA